MSLISFLIKEQRHIFGICPHCATLFRLVDIRISYDAPYKSDWLDKIERKQQKWGEKITDLEEMEEGLRAKAVESATRRELPRLLKPIVPAFVTNRVNPQDVKTIFHPINFVCFDGLSRDRVERVVLMDRKASDESSRGEMQRSLHSVIESGAVEWQTIRIGDRGEVEVE